MNQNVLDVIYEALEELNEQEASDVDRVPLAPDTPLFGKDGRLDSLKLVSLIIATEQKIEDRFGVAVTLADERAMSMASSPFATVDTFARYVESLLSESTRA